MSGRRRLLLSMILSSKLVPTPELVYTLLSGNTAYRIGDDTTSYGNGLTSAWTSGGIVIPKTYNNLPVTEIGQSSFRAKQFTSLVIPEGITVIKDKAFYGCYTYTNLKLPNSLTTIGESAFYQNRGLTSLVIPNNVTSISYNSFHECNHLKTIKLSNSLVDIQSEAFNYCTELESVELPATLTSIGSYAFYGCTVLTTFNYNGTIAQWNGITKGRDWKTATALTKVHCTDGDVNV